jgi:hypothetical protein
LPPALLIVEKVFAPRTDLLPALEQDFELVRAEIDGLYLFSSD